jgi:hypothetical protein
MWSAMHRLSIRAVRAGARNLLALQRGRRICGPVAQR